MPTIKPADMMPDVRESVLRYKITVLHDRAAARLHDWRARTIGDDPLTSPPVTNRGGSCAQSQDPDSGEFDGMQGPFWVTVNTTAGQKLLNPELRDPALLLNPELRDPALVGRDPPFITLRTDKLVTDTLTFQPGNVVTSITKDCTKGADWASPPYTVYAVFAEKPTTDTVREIHLLGAPDRARWFDPWVDNAAPQPSPTATPQAT